MTDAEIIDSVNEVLVEEFEVSPGKLQPGAHIFEDLGFDSLDVVDLVAAIQRRFQVHIRNDERVQSVRTIQDLYDYLIALRQEQEVDGEGQGL